MGGDNKFEDEIKRAKKVLENKSKNDKYKIARAMAMVTQLGLQMAFCIIAGVMLGIFIDRLLGTAPLFIIIFSLMGSVAAIKIIYDIKRKEWKD